MPALYILTSLIFAYLLGSLSPGYILVWILRRRSILTMGDGRPGGANVFREVGPGWGITVGFLDAAKGAVAAAVVLLVFRFPIYCVIPAALGAMAGHSWSVFFRFRGGDGVGVIMGIYVMLMPAVLLFMIALYCILLKLWAMRVRPFYLYHLYNWQTVFCITPAAVFPAGDRFLPSYWDIDPFTAFMLTLSIAAAGLIKPIERFGIAFLFKPSDFNTKYAHEYQKNA